MVSNERFTADRLMELHCEMYHCVSFMNIGLSESWS